MNPHESPADPPAVLVVDDDLYLLAAIKQTLALNGYAATTCGNPLEALARLGDQPFAAVLADIRMPEMNGMVLLERILERDPDLPVILITGHGDISLAVEAVKKGAYHFLQKPVDEDIILATLERAIERRQLVLENRRLEEQLTRTRESRSRFYGLVGSHPSMLELYRLIETIAHEPDPAFPIARPAPGKELRLSVPYLMMSCCPGQPAPYVAVNMGGDPGGDDRERAARHRKGYRRHPGAAPRQVRAWAAAPCSSTRSAHAHPAAGLGRCACRGQGGWAATPSFPCAPGSPPPTATWRRRAAFGGSFRQISTWFERAAPCGRFGMPRKCARTSASADWSPPNATSTRRPAHRRPALVLAGADPAWLMARDRLETSANCVISAPHLRAAA